MASLREMQQQFARAIRDSRLADVSPGVQPQANLAVYRHNSRYQFERALEIAYPVIRRRVGDDYFRQLIHHYRGRHPSRSGDLHWAGREFASFLQDHLAGTAYCWLADLARLEWACEQASVAAVRPSVGAEVLGRFAQSQLEHLVFELQPSLGLIESAFPVFTIWQANQTDSGPPVDQSLGSEQGFVLYRDDQRVLAPLPAHLFSYLCALMEGATLGEAMGRGGLDEAGLLEGLRLVFGEQMVCSVRLAIHVSSR